MISALVLGLLLNQTPKEQPPPVFAGRNFHRPSCGWNGDLGDDGRCHVRIVFSTDYPTVTCKVRKALPEENHQDEGQIIDCTWEPVK